MIAVGDVDPERAQSDELAGVFGDRGGGDRGRASLSEPSPGSPAPATSRRCAVVGREKAQAALAMAFPGPARRMRDHAAAQVWAAVASGLGGRLFEALRDRRSLAYTVVATAWQKARGGALLTYIATSPEREDEAREQMLVELERFTREPVSGGRAAAGGELPGGAGGGQPAERRRGGGRDPRRLALAAPAWRSWPIRRRRSGRSRRKTCMRVAAEHLDPGAQSGGCRARYR